MEYPFIERWGGSRDADCPSTSSISTRISLCMHLYAGIALERVAEGASFFCTRFEGPDNPESDFEWEDQPFVNTAPTKHRIKGHSPKDIVKSIQEEAKIKSKPPKGTFTISYPIATRKDQWLDFGIAREAPHDHFMAFVGGCEFDVEDGGEVEVLFMDLTPGQVAAMAERSTIMNRRWRFREEPKRVVLGDVPNLSVQEIIDKLIVPIVSRPSALYGVGILRPEGAFPELLPVKLELELVNIPVKWLSLADLSYGSANLLYHHLAMQPQMDCGSKMFGRPAALNVQLADKRLFEIVPCGGSYFGRSIHFFTTSKDHQVSATLRFTRENELYGDVVIYGLTPRLKGASRIKVMTERVIYTGDVIATVQEVGSNLMIRTTLREIRSDKVERTYIAPANTSVQSVEPEFGKDGIIGELPE